MDSTLKDKVDTLQNLLDTLRVEADKSDKGTLAAGARVRKQLQDLKKLAQEARVFCLERDHTRKVK